MNFELGDGRWLNEPKSWKIESGGLRLETDPGTDFWQRSYYGFQNDNGSALLFTRDDNFTFTVKTSFEYKSRFDQCGLLIYLDSENWFKASVEYENKTYSRLGSVVTNTGYSDWATTDIENPESFWYRLSRRGPDFLLESSFGGKTFRQMRVFHLHDLGKTTAEMGKADPPEKPEKSIRFGPYACSPLDAGFTVFFSEMKLEECLWKAHS